MASLKHSLALVNAAIGANACLSRDNHIQIDSFYLNTKDRFQSERVTTTLRSEMARMDRKLSRGMIKGVRMTPGGPSYAMRDLKFRRMEAKHEGMGVRSKAFPPVKLFPAEAMTLKFEDLVEYQKTHRRTVSELGESSAKNLGGKKIRFAAGTPLLHRKQSV